MDDTSYYHQPVANVAQLGPNPPLLDIFDADQIAEPFVARARATTTVATARRAAAHAELLLNGLETSRK